jgi:hypothetical protein
MRMFICNSLVLIWQSPRPQERGGAVSRDQRPQARAVPSGTGECGQSAGFPRVMRGGDGSGAEATFVVQLI